jgi:anthranilate phosphoribosyltransferase
MKPFAEALRENNVVHAIIVHSEDGMDEISPFAKTNIIELKDQDINEFTINPRELGITLNNINNIKGKNAIYNAVKIKEIYRGTINEFSVAVALNVAAGLIVSGKEYDFIDAFNKASKHLASGNVFQHLIKLQSK